MKRFYFLIPLSIFMVFISVSKLLAQAPTNGLVAWYSLDGNAIDNHINRFNGIIHGNVTPTQNRFGSCNRAMRFGGDASGNDWIEIADAALLRTGSDFTISCWFKKEANGGWVISKGRDINAGFYGITSNQATSKRDYNEGRDAISTTTTATGEWHFIAGVITARSVRFYLDGILEKETILTTDYEASGNTGYPLAFGRHITDPNALWAFPYPYVGALDDIRIYNRALSSQEITQIFNIPEALSTVSISANTQTVCNGSRATLTANPSVSGNYTYSWYKNGNVIYSIIPLTTPTFEVSEAGTYNVVVTANGCTSPLSAPITISQASVPSVFATANTQILCPNSTATLTATPSVSGNYTYQWYLNGNRISTFLPLTEPTFEATQTGNYTVVILVNGCASPPSAPVVISAGTTPVVTLSASAAACAGQQVLLSATQGMSNYEWSVGISGLTTYEISVTPTETTPYSVTVTNADGCTATASKEVTVSPSPTVTFNGNSAFCRGGSTSLTATGGGTYLWENGATSAMRSFNAAGNYSVTVTGGNTCTTTKSVAVTQKVPPSVFLPTTTKICGNSFTTLSTSTSNTNVTYQWFQGNTLLSGQNAANLRVNQAGMYKVVAALNGCDTTLSTTVTSEATPSVSLASSSGTSRLCANSNFTLTATTAETGLTYAWYRNDQLQTGQTGSTLNITQAGEYAVRVVRAVSGCDSTARLTILPQILVPDGLVAYYPFDGETWDNSGNKNYGLFNGGVSLVTDRKNNPNKAYGFDGSNISFNITSNAFNLPKFTYSMWVSPASYLADINIGSILLSKYDGIGNNVIVFISNTGKPSIRLHNGANTVYTQAESATSLNLNTWNLVTTTFDGTTLKVYVNQELTGMKTATLAYSPNNSTNLTLGKASWANNNYFNGSMTDIRIYNRALSADEIKLLAKPAAYNFAKCEGDTLKLTAPSVSGVSYGWKNAATGANLSGNNPFIQNAPTVADNLTYALDATFNGCVFPNIDTVKVNSINPTPSVSLPQNPQVCQSLALTLTPTVTSGTPPFTYAWSDVVGNIPSPRTLTPSLSAIYGVTVTDSRGCKSATTTNVSVNPRPVVVFSESSTGVLNKDICRNNTATLNTTANNGLAPYTFGWSNGLPNSNSVTTPPLSILGISTYFLTVTDNRGCKSDVSTANITVKSLPIAAATATPSAICAGTTTTVSASATSGNAPYVSYVWSNNLGNGTSVATPVLTLGTSYTVTVTDNLGCKGTATVPVSVYSLPNVAITAQPPVVCDSSATRLTVNASSGSGSYTYAWNPSVSMTNTYTTPPLRTPTNYSVTITDSRNCKSTVALQIGINPVPKAKAGINDTLTCAKQSINLMGTITANNAATVAVQWQRRLVSGGSTIIGNSLTIPNMTQTGTYIFIAQNTATGCTSLDSLVIAVDTIHPLFTFGRGDSTRCNYTSDGKITTATTSGRPPLQYKLDNGVFQDLGTFSNLVGGTYSVTVRGRNGCTDVKTVVVPKPTALTVDINTFRNFDYFYEGDVVPMSSKVINVRGNTRYQWTSDPSVKFDCTNCLSPKFTILQNTLVKLVASDAYNCSAQDTMSFYLRKRFDPDIITPGNSDGKNDKLMFPSLENCLIVGDCATRFPNCEITIVNRWGNTVFYAKPYLNDWDGRNQNGQELPGGTYYYLLRLNLSQSDIIRGNVLIAR